MNILFVVEHYYPLVGGAETLFKNLAEGLVKKGHSVTVCTSSVKDTKDYEVINGVEIYRAVVPQWGRRYWFTFLSILGALELAEKCDVIQTTTYNGAFPAWIASKLLRKPCVITVHEVLGDTWDLTMGKVGATLHRFLERVILKLNFDKYIGVSNHTKGEIAKVVDYSKVERIYNGIDLSHFKPCKPTRDWGSFTYAYFGRAGITKGVEYLLDAVPIVAKEIPNSRCVLYVPPYPKKEYLKVFNRAFEVGAFVFAPVLYGYLPNHMASMSCIVIPSLSEGFGYSAAEACAVGVPVVASAVGSLPEVVSGRYVFALPRDPQSIAQAIIKIYKEEHKVSRPREFGWDECITQYESVYQELLK